MVSSLSAIAANGPVELAVLARGVHVVEHPEQRLEDVAHGALLDHGAVTVDPSLVVDVLGLQPLQVGEPFRGEHGVGVGVARGRLGRGVAGRGLGRLARRDLAAAGGGGRGLLRGHLLVRPGSSLTASVFTESSVE